MAVDSANQHVFLTGPSGPNVQVFDFSGNSVGIIADPGASGVAISSGTLYVANCGGTSIDEFSTSTFAKIGSITTSQAMGYPCDLAVSGGRLWFDMQSAIFSVPRPASITIASPHTEFQLIGTDEPNYTVDPADTNTLLMSSQFGQPAYQDVWNIGASPPTRIANLFQVVDSGAGDTAAVAPDGSVVYLAGANAGATRWAMPDLSSSDETLMPSSGIAISVAVSPDGSRIAVGNVEQDTGYAGVDIFAKGQTTPLRSVNWPDTGEPEDLSYSADGTRLFVFSDPGPGSSTPTLNVITQANLAGSQIDVSPLDATVHPGNQDELTGRLTMQDAASAGAKTVTVKMTKPDSTLATLPAVTTAADGTYQVAIPALTQLGDYTFTVAFAGNATHAGSNAAAVVHVTKIASVLTVDANPSGILPGLSTTLYGMLTFDDPPAAAGVQIVITGQAPDTSSIDLGSVLTNPDGSFSVPTGELDQLGAYQFAVSYAGDGTHENAQAATEVDVSLIATTLALGANHRAIVYGNTITLTAHLNGGAPGAAVTITRTVAGTTSTAATGVLNGNLNFSANLQPGRNTTYRASYTGDATHLPSNSLNLSVGVAPLITASLFGNYGKTGLYRLFHYHTSCASSGSLCPIFTIHLKPNHAGKYVYTLLQGHTSSGWRNIVVWRHPLNRLSTAIFKVRYLSTRVIGHSYRLAAAFNGDGDHIGAARGYYYFEITR